MGQNYNKIIVVNLCVLAFMWLSLSSGQGIVTASTRHDSDFIAVKELQLIDNDGIVRGGLKFDVHNDPALYFTDRKMRLKTLHGVSYGNAKLMFFDNNKKPRMALRMSKNETPDIIMTYENGKGSIFLGSDSNKGNMLAFSSPDGKPGMLLAISKNQPRIGMFDKSERLRVMFGMNPGNSSVLAFLDENAYPALAMGHLLGTPMFRLQRPDKTGVFASYAPDNNVILSMQKEGRFTWSVPEIPRGGRAGDDPLNGIDWDNMIKGWNN